MSTITAHSKTETLVPVLRLPNFTDKWNEKLYGELFSFHPTNSFSRDLLNYEIGEVRNIHYGDIHTKFPTTFKIQNEHVPFVNPEVELAKIKSQSYCKEGDLVIADASEDYADIGKTIELIDLNGEKVIAGLHTFLARPISDDRVAIGFPGYLVQSWKVRKQIMVIAQGTKVLGISTGRLSKLKLNIPSLPEQQKIAAFLSAVDDKIQQLSRKKALLEEYKKGVMQQIFSQEIRFKNEDGNSYPDWEEKRLGDISQNVGYGMNAAATSFDGEHKYIRITDIDEYSHKFIASPQTSPEGEIDDKYKLSENDIVFARTGASVGKSYIYDKADGNLFFAGFLIRFNIKDADAKFVFIQTLHGRYREWVQVYSMRSGQPGLNAEEYKAYKINLPCLEEQQKISNLVWGINEQVDALQNQITQTQTFKKGLLQKMFV